MSVQSKIIAEIKRLSEQHIKDVDRMEELAAEFDENSLGNITDCMEAVKDRAAACHESIAFLLGILTEITDEEAYTETVAYSMEAKG